MAATDAVAAMAPGRWHRWQFLPTAQLRIEALEVLQGNGAVLGTQRNGGFPEWWHHNIDMVSENPMKIDDFGVPPFLESLIYFHVLPLKTSLGLFPSQLQYPLSVD